MQVAVLPTPPTVSVTVAPFSEQVPETVYAAWFAAEIVIGASIVTDGLSVSFSTEPLALAALPTASDWVTETATVPSASAVTSRP